MTWRSAVTLLSVLRGKYISTPGFFASYEINVFKSPSFPDNNTSHLYKDTTFVFTWILDNYEKHKLDSEQKGKICSHFEEFMTEERCFNYTFSKGNTAK